MDRTFQRLYKEMKRTYENSLYSIISDLGKETSTYMDWEGRKQFYTVLKAGFEELINDDGLYLSQDLDCCYRSGLLPCIKTYYEGIPNVVQLIQDISDYSERAKAVENRYGYF